MLQIAGENEAVIVEEEAAPTLLWVRLDFEFSGGKVYRTAWVRKDLSSVEPSERQEAATEGLTEFDAKLEDLSPELQTLLSQHGFVKVYCSVEVRDFASLLAHAHTDCVLSARRSKELRQPAILKHCLNVASAGPLKLELPESVK